MAGREGENRKNNVKPENDGCGYLFLWLIWF
jgi:hypothetical protein